MANVIAQIGKPTLHLRVLVAPGFGEFPHLGSMRGHFGCKYFEQTLLVARLFGETLEPDAVRFGIRREQRLERAAQSTQRARDE